MAALDGEDGLVFEQALVHRAELLDVQRRIVHSDELTVLRMFVEAERAQAAQQDIIAEGAMDQRPGCLSAEEIARKRGEAQPLPRAICFEEAEGC